MKSNCLSEEKTPPLGGGNLEVPCNRTRFKLVEGPESLQGSKEWLAFREGKISASMAPAIMGVSPFQTRLGLWEEIVFGKSRPKTRAMQRGIELEAKARDWLNSRYSDHYPDHLKFKPAVVQSVAYPDRIASLDGYFEYDGKVYIAEIKVPGIDAHLDALEGKIPYYYYPQLQHQMDLVGVDEMIYVSFDGEEGKILVCQRDKEYCQKLFIEEADFFASILALKPPEPSDRDWIECRDPEMVLKSFRYKELALLIDELETEKEEIKKYFVQNADHPRMHIGDLKMQKITRRGTLDYEKMIKDYDIKDLEKYRKAPTIAWPITY